MNRQTKYRFSFIRYQYGGYDELDELVKLADANNVKLCCQD